MHPSAGSRLVASTFSSYRVGRVAHGRAMAEPPKKRIKVSFRYGEKCQDFTIREGVSVEDNLAIVARTFQLSPSFTVLDDENSIVAPTYNGLDANTEYTIAGATALTEVGSSVFACRCLSIPETYDSRKKFLSVCDAVKVWLLTR